MCSEVPSPPAQSYDHVEVETRIARLWDDQKLYAFNAASRKPVYSVDTPPPYVSASHLHVGHAMSYSQAEFIVRFWRMKGYSIFYPMGFDDNGLPTERFVEKTYGVDKSNTTRKAFRELCMEQTKRVRLPTRPCGALWDCPSTGGSAIPLSTTTAAKLRNSPSLISTEKGSCTAPTSRSSGTCR